MSHDESYCSSLYVQLEFYLENGTTKKNEIIYKKKWNLQISNFVWATAVRDLS